jgi:ATP phosphoribosyltransferase
MSGVQSNPVSIVVPKQGRLREPFEGIMQEAGLSFKKANARHDYGMIVDKTGQPPIEAVSQRADDALRSLDAGVAQMAVVGLNTFLECSAREEEAGRKSPARIMLAFADVARCTFAIAAPKETQITSLKDLEGKRIATSYPALMRKWLAAENVTPAAIIERAGGVEDTIRQGIADAIMDLVQTGESLRANGLERKLDIQESSAVLIRTTARLSNDAEAAMEELAERLGTPRIKVMPSASQRILEVV